MWQSNDLLFIHQIYAGVAQISNLSLDPYNVFAPDILLLLTLILVVYSDDTAVLGTSGNFNYYYFFF